MADVSDRCSRVARVQVRARELSYGRKAGRSAAHDQIRHQLLHHIMSDLWRGRGYSAALS